MEGSDGLANERSALNQEPDIVAIGIVAIVVVAARLTLSATKLKSSLSRRTNLLAANDGLILGGNRSPHMIKHSLSSKPKRASENVTQQGTLSNIMVTVVRHGLVGSRSCGRCTIGLDYHVRPLCDFLIPNIQAAMAQSNLKELSTHAIVSWHQARPCTRSHPQRRVRLPSMVFLQLLIAAARDVERDVI